MNTKNKAPSEIKYSKSRVSIIPFAIEEKCTFAERKDSALTIEAGSKIKNESINVRTIQITQPTKKAII